MAGKLSFLQEEALIALHHGRRGECDPRAVRGLIVRGLVGRSDWVLGDHLTLTDSPHLTEAGAPIAAELASARREKAQMRRLRGTRFGLISGGKAPVEPEPPLSSEHRYDAGVGHAPSSAARGGSGAFDVIDGGRA